MPVITVSTAFDWEHWVENGGVGLHPYFALNSSLLICFAFPQGYAVNVHHSFPNNGDTMKD